MSRLLDNFRENWLSVKVLIYKEESVIGWMVFGVNRIEFWVTKWVKRLGNKDFDDMGYDMGFW